MDKRGKFSPLMIAMKRLMKKNRIDAGDSMYAGARKLGVSRKQLEDIEAPRNYGGHIDLEMFYQHCELYGVSYNAMMVEASHIARSIAKGGDILARPRRRRMPLERAA